MLLSICVAVSNLKPVLQPIIEAAMSQWSSWPTGMVGNIKQGQDQDIKWCQQCQDQDGGLGQSQGGAGGSQWRTHSQWKWGGQSQDQADGDGGEKDPERLETVPKLGSTSWKAIKKMEEEMAAKQHELHLQELEVIRQQALQGQLQASREQELFQAQKIFSGRLNC